MLGADSNFTKTLYLYLTPITECYNTLWILILLIGYEHPPLTSHMVCASSTNYPI
jgi:hypothetical protein